MRHAAGTPVSRRSWDGAGSGSAATRVSPRAAGRPRAGLRPAAGSRWEWMRQRGPTPCETASGTRPAVRRRRRQRTGSDADGPCRGQRQRYGASGLSASSHRRPPGTSTRAHFRQQRPAGPAPIGDVLEHHGADRFGGQRQRQRAAHRAVRSAPSADVSGSSRSPTRRQAVDRHQPQPRLARALGQRPARTISSSLSSTARPAAPANQSASEGRAGSG